MNTLLDYEFAYKLTMQQNETVTIPFLQKWIYSWAHGFLSVVWQICIRNSRLQVLMERLDSYAGGCRSPLHVWALLFTNERYRHPGPWRSVQIPVSGSVPASSVCLQHTMPLSSPYTVLCPVSVLLHGPCHWCPPAGPQARGSLSPWLFLTLWWRSRAHGLEPARCPVRVWVCDGAAETGSSFSVFGPKLEVFRASSGYCAQWITPCRALGCWAEPEWASGRASTIHVGVSLTGPQHLTVSHPATHHLCGLDTFLVWVKMTKVTRLSGLPFLYFNYNISI